MFSMLRDLFSGRDNRSLDIGRVLWTFSMFALFLFEGHSVWARGSTFDPLQFATACGGLLAAGGGSLALKAKTEPGS